MGKNSYKAQLNYYDHNYGWGNAGTCAQGDGRTWGAGSARTGVMYFPGLSNLKGKIINSVKITVTNRAGGQNAQKTAHFFRSASQGGINTSLGAGHKTGNQIGTLSGWFHAYAAASLSFTPTFFSSYIAAGEDTFCIYSATASEYLVWGAVTLEVDWQEPATQPSLSAATVEMGKAVTINTPAVNNAYRHTLRYAFGGASGTIATGIASSVSWTPPVSLANQIPSATAGSGTIYCDTYSGSARRRHKVRKHHAHRPRQRSSVGGHAFGSARRRHKRHGSIRKRHGQSKADAFRSIRRIRQQHHLVHDYRRRMDGQKWRIDNRHVGFGGQHHVHGHGDGFARPESQHYAHNQRHRLHKARRSGV